MTAVTTAPIKEKVTEWCRQERLLLEEVPDAKVRFRLKLKAPGTGPGAPGEADILHVLQPADSEDKIVVSTGLAFEEPLAGPMRRIPNRDEILLALEATLDGLAESYVVDHAKGFLRSLIIYDEIFVDGLTKDRFVRSLRGVHRGLLMAMWTLRPLIQALGGDVDAQLGLPGEDDEPVVTAAPKGAERPATVQCRSCGASLASGARFCAGCGAPVAMLPPSPVHCEACGSPIKAGARFCPSCGVSVSSAPSRS